MKFKFKWLGMIISIIMLFGLVGCSSKKNDTVTTVNGTEYTQDEIDKLDVANQKCEHLLNVKTSEITLENGKFVGTIQNTNTDVSVSDITIDLGIYNAQGSKIGDEYIYIGTINCGETYQINQDLYSYKYKDMSTYKLAKEEVNINE